MKPRLQAVLGLRRSREDEAKRALGALEHERAAIIAQRTALEAALGQAASAPVPPALREQLSAYAAATRSAAADCDRRTAECDGRITAARDALAAAHRDVRAIEAIQARDRTAAARTALRREGRDNDEFAARRGQEVGA